MATIKLDYTKPAEPIEISIGVLTMNLTTRKVTVRLSITGHPRKEVQVDMMSAYNTLSTADKTLIRNWYK